MDYVYSFLLKISVSILLLIATFNVWKTPSPEVFNWLIPFIALFWIFITISEGIRIKRDNKWFEEKEGQDERTINYSYKAGYITFWINITILSLLFFVYSIVGFSLIPPMSGLVILVFLNIIMFFCIRLFFIFYQ
ncbi:MULTISPECIES: hypothetical protein [Salinicoccus]|uniref:hypothetical protein n=1 Tax=Salinicoccus TaxID=45669 RepID=UPI0004E1C6BE|nr:MULTISPECIES: hypothetical protein [Salinicoccus]GGA64915.1 hypothetical protein GCM10007176_06650 [Salinicoccus roseus]